MNATVTQMAQMPSGTPRFDGANHGAIATTPTTPMMPMPAPSSTRLAMNTGTLVESTPANPPTMARISETMPTLRTPYLLTIPAAGNAMTIPST